MTAREDVLGRVAAALRDVPPGERPEDVAVERAYRSSEDGDAVERFVERIAEYETTVRRVTAGDIASAAAEQCRLRGVARLGIPFDLPLRWRPESPELVVGSLRRSCARYARGSDDRLRNRHRETGSICRCGRAAGSRALSLVPDYHLCVVEARKIVGGVPEGIRAIAVSVRRRLQPVTFVSGPSATSDIELSRVQGVHGPRTLDVLVVTDA